MLRCLGGKCCWLMAERLDVFAVDCCSGLMLTLWLQWLILVDEDAPRQRYSELQAGQPRPGVG